MSPDFSRVAYLVAEGRTRHAFPAAVIEVGNASETLWREAFGQLDYDEDAAPTEPGTIFDLASLTKVIATTTLAMRLVDGGQISLTDRIARWVPEWRGIDRDEVTLRSLLNHSSGLTAWLPFYRDYSGRRDFQHAICSLPLEYAPDTHSIYSDLGFILLGFILEDAAGESFEAQCSAVIRSVTSGTLLFNPPSRLKPIIAPTERDPWRGPLLAGEVHDENCWALGGTAGHAGLFGIAEAAGDFCRAMLTSLEGAGTIANASTVRTFVTRSTIPGSRALGWDTMLPTSSCGTKISPTAFGHTGFTGTSIWIDPERKIYVVFLTNRVNPTRENELIQQIRPRVHDAVIDTIDLANR